MQLLRDVEAKRQARQLGWPGDAKGVGQGDAIDPFDVNFTAFRAGDIDGHAGPRLALVRDANSMFTAPFSSRSGWPFRRNEKP